MLKNLLLNGLLILFSFSFSYAQLKVEDGTSNTGTITPNANAVLDLNSIQRGVLFPRIPLESSTSPSPLTKHEAGMMVYNLSTKNDLKAGIYYNDGQKWISTSSDSKGSGINYNPITYTLTFIDDKGDLMKLDFQQIVTANQTITSLIKGVDGSYLYTAEDGKTTLIDVPADVIENFQQIMSDSNVQKELTLLIKQVAGNVFFDGSSFSYVDNQGNSQVINLDDLLNFNETVTSLTRQDKGVYTYLNEAGDTFQITVIGDVIKDFETIIEDQDVLNQLVEIVNKYGATGNVLFDGTSFTYMDKDGTQKPIDMERIVKNHETKTTMLKQGSGLYTYTNEVNQEVTIDVTADVIEEVTTNFQTIIDHNNVDFILNEYINNVKEILHSNGWEFWFIDDMGNQIHLKPSEMLNLRYSEYPEPTGKRWVDYSEVFEIALPITLENPTNEIKLPDVVWDKINIIEMRLTNEIANTITTSVAGYSNDTRILKFGPTASGDPLHPAGDYRLILEFIPKWWKNSIDEPGNYPVRSKPIPKPIPKP